MGSILRMILVAALLGGCATLPDTNYREKMESLPGHYDNFDMKLAWTIHDTAAGTVIDGILGNVRYAEMSGIEVWVTALDANGTTLSKKVSFVIPRKLVQDEFTPFSLTLPLHAAPGSTLHFTYHYTAQDGQQDGITWMQGFDTQVPPR